MGGLLNGRIPDLHTPLTSKQGIEHPPFRISAYRLEIDENVKRAYFRIHLLVVKWCNEQSYRFRQSPKWVNADRAQFVQSSSGLIAVVLMMLLLLIFSRFRSFAFDRSHSNWSNRQQFVAWVSCQTSISDLGVSNTAEQGHKVHNHSVNTIVLSVASATITDYAVCDFLRKLIELAIPKVTSR